MVKGGYQILNLKSVELSGTAYTLPGIYNQISNIHEKAIMVTGLNIEGEEFKDYFTQPIIEDGYYKLTVGKHTLVITPDDGVSVLEGIIGGDGGGSEVTSYEQLSNKPQINNVTLSGNKSLDVLGIQHKLTAGSNIHIDSNNVISADDTQYTAGDNISISPNGVISATDTKYESLPERQNGTDWSLVTTGEKYNYNHKQDALTAGANIDITNGVISAVDTTYGAGQNITITTDPTTGEKIINAQTSGGTADYDQLSNRPQINGNTLTGDKSASQLGLQKALTPGAGISIDANDEISVSYGVEPPVQEGAVWSLVTTGEKYVYASKASNTPTFTRAPSRTNINSGETLTTIFGKIKRWFSDLKGGAFEDIYWSSFVSCAIGDTSVTITNSNITANSVIEPFTKGLTTPVACDTITVTAGQVVITFEALTTACSIGVRITNR